jgi:hypothetical protein
MPQDSGGHRSPGLRTPAARAGTLSVLWQVPQIVGSVRPRSDILSSVAPLFCTPATRRKRRWFDARQANAQVYVRLILP